MADVQPNRGKLDTVTSELYLRNFHAFEFVWWAWSYSYTTIQIVMSLAIWQCLGLADRSELPVDCLILSM